MRRPKTERLLDPKKPPCGFVLKREFSDGGEDVYVPSMIEPLRVSAEIKRAAAFVRKRTEANPNDECLWLTQEYVPFLSIGEVRFVCVGGRPIREVVTGKNLAGHPESPGQLWAYERNESLRTVAALQWVVPTSHSSVPAHQIRPGHSWTLATP